MPLRYAPTYAKISETVHDFTCLGNEITSDGEKTGTHSGIKQAFHYKGKLFYHKNPVGSDIVENVSKKFCAERNSVQSGDVPKVGRSKNQNLQV